MVDDYRRGAYAVPFVDALLNIHSSTGSVEPYLTCLATTNPSSPLTVAAIVMWLLCVPKVLDRTSRRTVVLARHGRIGRGATAEAVRATSVPHD